MTRSAVAHEVAHAHCSCALLSAFTFHRFVAFEHVSVTAPGCARSAAQIAVRSEPLDNNRPAAGLGAEDKSLWNIVNYRPRSSGVQEEESDLWTRARFSFIPASHTCTPVLNYWSSSKTNNNNNNQFLKMDVGSVVCCCVGAVLFVAYKLGLLYQLFHKAGNLSHHSAGVFSPECV